MRITYLVTSTESADPAERAALAQAGTLGEGHQVRVIGLTRPPGGGPDLAPAVTVEHLVGTVDGAPRPCRPSGLDAAACAALAAAPGTVTATAMTDIEAETALAGLDTDILITAGLVPLALATRLRPGGALLVHQTCLVPEDWTSAEEPLLLHAPRVDALITTTRHAADWLASSLGPAAPPLTVIPPDPPAGPRLQSSLTSPTIVLADHLTTGRNIDHAVTAFARIAGRFPDWTLRIHGTGPARASLAKMIESLSLQDQVQLLGRAPHLPDELAKASIRVVTGPSAGSGHAYAEAFAAGIPVVAYAHPGSEEFVIHDGNGHLVPADDTGALATTLAALMDDEPARLRLGQGALATTLPAPGASRWTELFERLVTDRPGAHLRRAERVAAHTTRTVAGYVPAARAAKSTGQRGDRTVEVRDDLGPHEVARLNLRAVADVLERAQVPFLVLRDRGLRHRVAITQEHRDAAVAALGTGLEGFYAQPLKPKPGTPPSGSAADIGRWPPGGGIRLFRLIAPPSRTLQFGADCGCDVEFWTATPQGGLKAPRATLLGDTFPANALDRAELTIGDRSYPTLRAFTLPMADEVTFPIDAVYTWVDGADPAWQARRVAALDAAGLRPSKADGGDSRYASRDELRYSLRSLAMHAPWIQRVWIVTDQQTPPWLDTDHPGVTVVDHRDIFDDPAALPTFNSHAIETRLHHIDGLAEHFLYLNDDFFLARPLAPERFFHPTGTTRYFPSPATIPPGPRTDRDATWLAAAKNNRALIEQHFGRSTVHALKHAPYALRRSTLYELERRFTDELAATARTLVRTTGDLSLVSSLYHYYALCTGQAAPAELSVDTIPLSHSEGMATLTRLLTLRDRDAFCLNDMASGDLTEPQKWRAATGFLESYFPIAGPYERRSSSAGR